MTSRGFLLFVFLLSANALSSEHHSQGRIDDESDIISNGSRDINNSSVESFCELKWDGNRSTFCCFKGVCLFVHAFFVLT
jgi:hypothetical protein